MEKNTEYLRLLQERNRLKKMMSMKSKEEQERDDLERGFRTQFRGANAELIKDNEKAHKVTAKSNKPFAVINRLIPDASKAWGQSDKKSGIAICTSDHSNIDAYTRHSSGSDDGIEYEPDFDEPSDVDEMTMEHDYEGSRKTIDDSSSWNEDDETNMQLFISQLAHGTDKDGAYTQMKSSTNESMMQVQASSLRVDNNQSHRSPKDKGLSPIKDTSTQHIPSDDGSNTDAAVKPINSISMTTSVVSRVNSEVYDQPKAVIDDKDVDEWDLFLQKKMSKLTSEQKKKLLLALQQQSSEEITASSAHENDHAMAVLEPAGAVIALNDINTQEERVDVDHIPSGMINALQEDRLLSRPLSSMDPGHSRPLVSIRIRILTTWSKSSFVSLRAIRLRLFNYSIGTSDEAMTMQEGSPFVDVLHGLKCRIFQGMVPMPVVSESMRTLSILTAGHDSNLLKQSLSLRVASTSYRPVGKHQLNFGTWKGPFKLDNPLDLVFEGVLSDQLDSNHWVNRVSEVELQKRMGLVIWNGSSPVGSYSSAKDVDVYVGSRCVWSGQLEEISSSGPSANTSNGPQTQLYSSEETCPSVVIFPLAGTKPDPPPSQIRRNTDIQAVDQDEASVPSGEVVVPLLREGTVLFDDNPVVEKERTEDKPKWLTGIVDSSTIPMRCTDDPPISSHLRMTQSKSKVRRRSAEEPPTPSSSSSTTQQLLNSPKPSSSRIKQTRNSDIEPSQQEVNGATSPGIKSRGTGSERKYTSRRNRSHLLKDLNMRVSSDMDSIFVDALSDSYGESSMQLSEADLEKSLDAITFAEKFNLGRLSTTNLDRAGEEDESEEAHVDDSLDDRPVAAALDGKVDSKESAATQSCLMNTIDDVLSPNRHDNSDNTSIHSNLKVTSVAKDLRAVERMAKIDLVQEKINITLAGLAGIMSSLSTTTDNAFTKRAAIDTSTLSKRDSTTEHSSDEAPIHLSYRSEVPTGETLRLYIYSTWGDQNYVGLNGLEFFDGSGALIQPHLRPEMAPCNSSSKDVYIYSIEAYPSGLGSLSAGDVEDPRKVTNLLDGVNITRNDLHVWLAPQINALHVECSDPLTTEDSKIGLIATITVRFSKSTQLSFMRIFNYNKSRTHNQRGVKQCKILLDDNIIFEG